MTGGLHSISIVRVGKKKYNRPKVLSSTMPYRIAVYHCYVCLLRDTGVQVAILSKLSILASVVPCRMIFLFAMFASYV